MRHRGIKIASIIIGSLVLLLVVSGLLLVTNANRIVKHELESRLGKNFSVGNIDLHWDKVEASDLRLKGRGGKDSLTVKNLALEADFISFLKKQYIVSRVIVEAPHLLVETNRKGDIVSPVFPLGEEAAKVEATSVPFTLKQVDITKGSLDYLDGKVSTTPVLTKLRELKLEVRHLALPLDGKASTFRLSGIIPGTGGVATLKGDGSVKLDSKDLDARIEVRNLDIVDLKPYFQQGTNVNVTRGFLDLDMDAKIVSHKIRAPGRAVLRNLEFESRPGLANSFLGIPLSAVVAFLKSSNNEISVTFVLEGDLDNPKFDIRENMVQRITMGLADKLGLSVSKIGESIVNLGAQGARTVEKGVKGIGEGIKRLFK
jgi:hypothetical protein